MASEVQLFLLVVLGSFVVAMFWLSVVYLPGRALERWEDQRPRRSDRQKATAVDPGRSARPLRRGT